MFEVPSVFLPDVIVGHARNHPDKVALVCDDATLTWSAFDQAINGFARFLGAHGVGRGDRVAILAEPSAAAMVAQFGTLRAGACVASLSGMASGEALSRMLVDSGAGTLVSDDHFGAMLANLPEAAALRGPALRICIGRGLDGWSTLADVQDQASAAQPQPFPRIEWDDEFVILYSSGTTGVPKGIVLSHGCRLANCWLLTAEQRYDSNAVVLSATALYSNTTWSLVTTALFVGGTAVVMRKFDAAKALELLQRWRVSHSILVPAILRMVLEAPGSDAADLTSIRMMCTTGSQMPLPLKRRAIERFPGAYFEVYGLTEGLILVLKPEDAAAHMDSVGKPMLGNDIRIIDDTGGEVPRGDKGEIVGYGPLLMTGYHRRPDATEEAIWREPITGRTFLRSGDIGYFDTDGFLHLVDRKKDMLVSGGYNVYPADIERIIAQRPDVLEATVIGVPHEKWGETPWACVVLRPGVGTSADEMKVWINERVGKHERVSAVRFLDGLPRNAGGKILKRALRDTFADQTPPSE